MMFTIHLHQPRLSAIPFEEATKIGSGKAWDYTRAGYLDQDHRQADKRRNTEDWQQKCKAQKALSVLLGEFLITTKPSGHRASLEWLNQDQAQRAASGRFWAQMRRRYRQTLERIQIEGNHIESDLVILPADLAPKHVLEVQKEHDEIRVKMTRVEANKKTKKEASNTGIQTQWGADDQNTKSDTAQKMKVKVKNRAEEHTTLPDVANLHIADEVRELPSIKVAVSKRSLDTHQPLYPNPNFEERTKGVD
jgi:hypothetical protein